MMEARMHCAQTTQQSAAAAEVAAGVCAAQWPMEGAGGKVQIAKRMEGECECFVGVASRLEERTLSTLDLPNQSLMTGAAGAGADNRTLVLW